MRSSPVRNSDGENAALLLRSEPSTSTTADEITASSSMVASTCPTRGKPAVGSLSLWLSHVLRLQAPALRSVQVVPVVSTLRTCKVACPDGPDERNDAIWNSITGSSDWTAAPPAAAGSEPESSPPAPLDVRPPPEPSPPPELESLDPPEAGPSSPQVSP